MRQVVLLRGVNVGPSTKVAMSELRALVASLGYSGVRTHLQSGNVVLSSDDPPEETAQRIEDQTEARFGIPVRVLARTRDELADVVEANPLLDIATDPARLVVAFLSEEPDPGLLAGLDPAVFEPERFHARGRELYLWYANGQQRAKLSHSLLERRLGVAVTARNWNTVTRLLALADE